jgi:hypothetical protein
MKQQVQLKSGHTLTINLASLDDGQNLVNVFAATLREVRLDISADIIRAIILGPDKIEGEGPEDYALRKRGAVFAAFTGHDANFIWNLGLTLLQARRLQDAVLACATKCMLNAAGAPESIIRGSFEIDGARRDFYPTLWEVLKANLTPFFEDLLSALSGPSKSTPSSQK